VRRTSTTKPEVFGQPRERAERRTQLKAPRLRTMLKLVGGLPCLW
jgi:hypothetical protein